MHPQQCTSHKNPRRYPTNFWEKGTNYCVSSATWPWQKQTVRIRTLAVALALIRITIIVNHSSSLLYSRYPQHGPNIALKVKASTGHSNLCWHGTCLACQCLPALGSQWTVAAPAPFRTLLLGCSTCRFDRSVVLQKKDVVSSMNQIA